MTSVTLASGAVNSSAGLTLKVNNTTSALDINTSGAVGVGSTPGYGTSGQVLLSAGSAAAPTWGSNLSSCTADGTDQIGFKNIPQNAKTGSYTLVLADSGKHIFHASGAGAATYTIPAAASVAYPLGTAITFVNLSATSVSIEITTDTLYLAGTGTTGTRTLAQYGTATAIKVSGVSSAGIWIISGAGLT